ncbi:1,3-beta-glucanosyltransferase [Basidiobolus ranarum]|uniref:1,3-beta-glucanosyltransferase n=1 Tax=Basidiobolus ranarum TaxID=34480 RepID=A0ABR2WUG5_9FUNG
MSAYTSDLKPSTCPAAGPNWLASSNIPPTPSKKMCSEMAASLKCVYSPGSNTVTGTQIEGFYSFLCGKISCAAIADTTDGVYGEFAGCSADQRLSYIFNEYYKKNGEKAEYCKFNGLGAVVTPTYHGVISEPENTNNSTTSTNESTDNSPTSTLTSAGKSSSITTKGTSISTRASVSHGGHSTASIPMSSTVTSHVTEAPMSSTVIRHVTEVPMSSTVPSHVAEGNNTTSRSGTDSGHKDITSTLKSEVHSITIMSAFSLFVTLSAACYIYF